MAKEGHTAAYRPGDVASEPDGRLYSPAFARNHRPILETLRPWLDGARGEALEIGAGCGQHACELARAFPGLRWTPTDPDPVHRRSIDAWAELAGLANIAPAEPLDAGSSWGPEREGALAVIFCANVVHIAPWRVAEGIVAGAGVALAPDGLLFLYGPFREGGRHTGPGNEAFDAGLRADNAEWGVRDAEALGDLAEAAGLEWTATEKMPADNRILVFRKHPAA